MKIYRSALALGGVACGVALLALTVESQVASVSRTSIDLPPQMTGEGVTYQSGIDGQPWETKCNGSLDTCLSASGIAYDWAAKRMFTHFEPCVPLLTPDSGSAEACQYYLYGNNVYYVFQNQPLVGGTVTSEPQCCLIEGLSLVSPKFPSYVRQYTAGGRCGDDVPIADTFRMHAQGVTWNPTPGGGFYGYYPEVPKTVGEDSYVTPNGFGGITPSGTFTQITFADIAPNLRQPLPSLPTLCQGEVPSCTTTIPNVGTVTLTDLFGCLQLPQYGACMLCHNTLDNEKYPDPFPCCPDGKTGCPTAQPPQQCVDLLGPPATSNIELKRSW